MDTNYDYPTDWPFDRDLGFVVYDLARLMRLYFDRKVRDTGLTAPQWTVMCQVIREDGLRQTDLAAELGMEKAPLGKLLDRLEEGNWITRRADLDDRRAKRIYRTARVEPFAGLLREQSDALSEVAFAGFPESARPQLIGDLIAMRQNLRRELNENEADHKATDSEAPMPAGRTETGR